MCIWNPYTSVSIISHEGIAEKSRRQVNLAVLPVRYSTDYLDVAECAEKLIMADDESISF